MSDTFKIALGQITVEKSSEENLRKCTGWMERASGSGARMIVFPEGVIATRPGAASMPSHSTGPS